MMTAAITANRLGFCQRCGDPISNKLRCSRCGGTSKEPRIRSTQALPTAEKKLDPWATKYVRGQFGDPGEQGAKGKAEEEEEGEYLHNQPPPVSPKRASYDPALGFGMPSRISRDLRSSVTTQANSLSLDLLGTSPMQGSRLSPAPIETTRRLSNDYSAPLVKGSDGVLSKVCGSLVEPSSRRNRWACVDCNTVFARDSTLYAAPCSLQAQDSSYYCRDCYCKRYSLGSCSACNRAVLGSTKEDGKYVKAPAGIWHGKCWKCIHCNTKEPLLVGIDGRPVCEACFDRPKPRRIPSPQPLSTAKSRQELGLPDVRRLTRVGGASGGAMGATIAELTKKLAQTSVSSSSLTSRSASNTSLSRSGCSGNSLEASAKTVFPQYMPTSPTKPAMTSSASITASPPKPRPLTARFREGMDLAAFKPSFSGQSEPGMIRRDSRSRSVSPSKPPPSCIASAKQTEKNEVSPSSSLEAKVPGSPSLTSSTRSNHNLGVVVDQLGRRRTSSRFPLPLNSPFSKNEPTEPNQGEKSTDQPVLEAVQGTVRCAACQLLPFEGSSAEEVLMVTLADGVHLHAKCFKCSLCQSLIDGTKTFVRLQQDAREGSSAYAHPHCSPAIQLVVPRVQVKQVDGGQKSFRTTLDACSAGGSHATHQRELKPSPTPSPATCMPDRTTRTSNVRQSILPPTTPCESVGTFTSSSAGASRFQPTAGAAPPTSSTMLASSHSNPSRRQGVNPAAGIFTRLNALSSASGTSLTPSPSPRVFGGMQTCAYCGEKLSSLESVLGPRGTQWHKNCLICRAPPPEKKGEVYAWRKQRPTICGKKLDSGAKVNREGEVRCRDCYDRQCSSFRVKA
ncbi:hypothetical protein NDA14_004176 [Ustilago hordei]|nr:hypothetical protein NDA15_006413 [Ustilago hordei]KAJ1571708.1 hypothetical protein NDA12_000173 [Ustilago hordei]KAJ1604184.1 hypothetical protein NDA14_004176 [Ustilago hordei]